MKTIYALLLTSFVTVIQFVPAQNNDYVRLPEISCSASEFYEMWPEDMDMAFGYKQNPSFEINKPKNPATSMINGEAKIKLVRKNINDIVRIRFVKSNEVEYGGYIIVMQDNGPELKIDPDFLPYITLEQWYCLGLPISSSEEKVCKYCGNKYKKATFYFSGFDNGEYYVPGQTTNMYLYALDCPESPSGCCDGLFLEPLHECGDPVECDKASRNDIRNN